MPSEDGLRKGSTLGPPALFPFLRRLAGVLLEPGFLVQFLPVPSSWAGSGDTPHQGGCVLAAQTAGLWLFLSPAALKDGASQDASLALLGL